MEWDDLDEAQKVMRECRAVFGAFDLKKLFAESPYLHSIVRHAMDNLDLALQCRTEADERSGVNSDRGNDA